MIRRLLLLLVLLCLAAGLVGCNNDPNPPPYYQTREDGSPWVVRYWGLTEDPRSLDPQVTYDQMSRRVIEPVYDCLLDYHPMKTDPYELIPSMLETIPVREDGANGKTSYLCRLKQGIRFHDDPCFPGGKGREVVAADVYYAFQRLCDPKVESPFLANFAEYVEGMAEAHAAAAERPLDYSRPLRAIEVLDSHTFRIHLLKPYPQILYYLAMHCTSPVAREAVEYYDGKSHGGAIRPLFKFNPVGTGPFRIREYVPRQRVRLERVPNYTTVVFPSDGFPPEKAEWLQKLAGRQLPLVDEIHLGVLREPIPIFVLTRQGYLDQMIVNKDAFAAMISPHHRLTEKFSDRGMFLEKDVDPSTFWTSFNLDDPVIGSNKKLRQALSSAYNAQGYVDIFHSGVPPVAHQMVPPGLYGYDKDFVNPYGYNLDNARRLLAEAGYPNGRDAKTGRQLEISMDVVASGGEDRLRAEFDQRCFEALGIRVRINENTFARMLERQDHGTYQLASGTGWGADYPDPENFLFLYYSKNVPPTGKNISRYRSPEFDRLFEQMATMENTPERRAIVQQMNTLLAEDCPMILNFHKAYYTIVQPWARRTHSNSLLEGGLKYAVADPVMRAEKRKEWNQRPVWPIFLAVGLLVGGVVYAVNWNRRQNA